MLNWKRVAGSVTPLLPLAAAASTIQMNSHFLSCLNFPFHLYVSVIFRVHHNDSSVGTSTKELQSQTLRWCAMEGPLYSCLFSPHCFLLSLCCCRQDSCLMGFQSNTVYFLCLSVLLDLLHPNSKHFHTS